MKRVRFYRDPLRRWKESEKLPPGHVERRRAREILEKRYSQCLAKERIWRKRFKKSWPRFQNPREALQFCNELCRILGEKPIRKIEIDCKETYSSGAVATYKKGVIRFGSLYIGFGTLVHELSHHMGGHGHGNDFCNVQDIIFAAAYEKITDKTPKNEWWFCLQ